MLLVDHSVELTYGVPPAMLKKVFIPTRGLHVGYNRGPDNHVLGINNSRF